MKTPTYWSGLDEFEANVVSKNGDEFSGDVPLENKLENATEESLAFNTNRRDFLKIFGFGMTAATLAACNESPLKKAIPYVVKPEEITPGIANYFSSTCNGCSAACPVIVKTREGRPIKLEGNPDSRLTKGGMCAVGHATVLNLYDIDRLKKPLIGKNEASWADVDKAISDKLNALKGKGSIRVLSNTITSPSTLTVINDFLTVYGGTHVMYDPVSYYAIAQSHGLGFDKAAIPQYNFDKAEVIVSFGADFLGTWLSPIQYSAQYVTNRDPKAKKMSRHFQVEALLSLTGTNADVRYPINASQEGLVLANLYNKVARKLGKAEIPGVTEFNVAGNGIDVMAEELSAASGRSLVVCGTNDLALQQIVNGLNAMLGNYGVTVDITNPSFQKQGNDAALNQLIQDIKSGAVQGLIVYGANPIFDTPYGEELKSLISKLSLSVSFANKTDETSTLCQYTCPDSHEMESWNDANPVAGNYSINQPTINTIYLSRQAQQSLLNWASNPISYKDYIKAYWAKNIITDMIDSQWDDVLRKGVFHKDALPAAAITFKGDLVAAATEALAAGKSGIDLVLYEKIGIRDGKHANNPFLQELPDPVTRTTWDGYATISVKMAKDKNLKNEDVIEISAGGKKLKLPVIVQPGQAAETIGVALGYGRGKEFGKTIEKVGGENGFPLVAFGKTNSYRVAGVSIASTGDTYPIAKLQKYDLLTDSNPKELGVWGDDFDRTEAIIRESSLENYIKKPDAGNEVRAHIKQHLITLWDSHYKEEESKRIIRWVMAIDLNKCTGCGACVVSCNAENNVPVVGKKEIMRHRDMHWMRIDRYYSGDYDKPETIRTVHQPMMCQHCANAPCETVCPVLATVHTSDGLNAMAYNRCVGTRYCANNCPYKVRRFNWFKYHNNDNFDFHQNNPLGKLVLNPDVTVRFRGVMEKCSFCVQRIQDGKLKAKINAKQTEGASFTKPKDGDIKTACQQSCPTGAIVFGDLNDPESEVSKLFRDERAFTVLEEVKTLPSVSYMTKIRNVKQNEVFVKHGGHEGEHKEADHKKEGGHS